MDGVASRHSGNLEGLVGEASGRGQEMAEEKVGLPGQQGGGSGPEERREGQRQGTFQWGGRRHSHVTVNPFGGNPWRGTECHDGSGFY